MVIAPLRALHLASLLVFLGLSACSSNHIDIGRVEVELDLAARRTLEKRALQTATQNALSQSAGFRFADGEGATLRVDVASAVPAQGDEKGRVRVTTSLVRRSGDVVRGTGTAEGQDPLFHLAVRAIEAAVADIDGALTVREQPAEALEQLLLDDAAAPSQRAQAARLVAQRKLKHGANLIIPLLENEDAELSEAALAALTDLKDPVSVPAVIRYAESQPNQVRRAAIEAVRVMPTYDGAAWLFVLSTGHADADVRAAATDAFNAVEPLVRRTRPGPVAQGDVAAALGEPRPHEARPREPAPRPN